MNKGDIIFGGIIAVCICGVCVFGGYALNQFITYNDDCISLGYDKQMDKEYVSGKKYIECARYDVVDGELIKQADWFEIET